MGELSEEKKPEKRREEILRAATQFFLEKGYENTSMRQIAAAADVSLGLVAYHFKTKRDIALEIVSRMYHRFAAYAKMYVNCHKAPVLYSSLLVNLNYLVFSSERYRAFYEDVLRNDILFDIIARSGVETYMRIRDMYRPELPDQEAEKMGWYGNYVSISMERTLVLYGKEMEMQEEAIPDAIFRSYMGLWHFQGVDQLINKAVTDGRELSERIIQENPEILSAAG